MRTPNNWKNHLVIFASTAVFLSAVNSLAWFSMGGGAVIVGLTVTAITITGLLLEIHRRLGIRLTQLSLAQTNLYQQTESLFSLFFTLKPNLPLPVGRGWAASPDFLNEILKSVLTSSPNLILEGGCGLSTLIIAYSLKKIGHGKVMSLEHDPKFAAQCRNLISLHGLDDFATIIDAPISEVTINGSQWKWYDISALKFSTQIDMCVIDGPPGSIQPLARYPALPLLHKYLSPSAILLLDDGDRPDERMTVERWQAEFANVIAEFLHLEKGAFLIRFAS